MPLNNFSASFISRSNAASSGRGTGKNSIAHAAYCRRETLVDERTGEKFDGLRLGNGQDVEWSAIYIPKNAPEWMRDPSKLWNALEKREDQSRRRDSALLSRSWIMTFPKELNANERILVSKDFMRMLTRDGWVVDLAIHGPDKDNGNWHAHAHIPMRHINEDGFGKRRMLFEKGVYTKQDELKKWKERWSDINARMLERKGLAQEAQEFKHGHQRLDQQQAKAYERGDDKLFHKLDREPQIHVGAAATGMERNGKTTHNGTKNKEILERNKQRVKEFDADKRLIRKAYDDNRTANGFRIDIDKLGFKLARVTDVDLAVDRTKERQEIFAKAGEYVVINGRGRIHHLTSVVTGENREQVAKFLEPLKREKVPSVSEARMLLAAEREPKPREPLPTRGISALGKVAGSVKGIGKALDSVGDLLGGPTLTPEQQRQADQARILRDIEAQISQKIRDREGDRGRDR